MTNELNNEWIQSPKIKKKKKCHLQSHTGGGGGCLHLCDREQLGTNDWVN